MLRTARGKIVSLPVPQREDVMTWDVEAIIRLGVGHQTKHSIITGMNPVGNAANGERKNI